MPMTNYLILKKGILNLVVFTHREWRPDRNHWATKWPPLSLISTAFWFHKRRLCKLFLSPDTNAKGIGDMFSLLYIDNTNYFDARAFIVQYQKCSENKFLRLGVSKVWPIWGSSPKQHGPDYHSINDNREALIINNKPEWFGLKWNDLICL